MCAPFDRRLVPLFPGLRFLSLWLPLIAPLLCALPYDGVVLRVILFLPPYNRAFLWLRARWRLWGGWSLRWSGWETTWVT